MLTGITLAATLLVSSPAPAAPAVSTPVPVVHCQVPCGIDGDHLRVEMLVEHAATIEKAMKQIEEIDAADKPNWNQLVRWVTTKDQHAQEIQDQVSAYWLAQRIKAPKTADDSAQQSRYVTQLMMAHRLTTFAMKCKQTTDVANVEGLRASLEGLKGAYFSKEDLEHLNGHSHK
ncbi:MAG: superoxide dismutase [Ni] [Planctomycetota bacterium]